MEAALRHHGIMHLLFHPAHIAKPGVADAIFTAARETTAAGMVWWTAAQINQWERARRQAKWQDYHVENGVGRATLASGAELLGATVLWLGDDVVTVEGNGARLETKLVTRWGFPFHAATLDVQSGQAVSFSVTNVAATA
jgi:hypothetical protein